MQGFDSLPRLKGVRSSPVERFTDNEEVDGPIPSEPTALFYSLKFFLFSGRIKFSYG